MNTHIWKYDLPHHGENSIELPASATVLAIREQNNAIVVWIEQPVGFEATTTMKFQCVFTGEPFDKKNDWRYLATVQVNAQGIPLVVHVYQTMRSWIAELR